MSDTQKVGVAGRRSLQLLLEGQRCRAGGTGVD